MPFFQDSPCGKLSHLKLRSREESLTFLYKTYCLQALLFLLFFGAVGCTQRSLEDFEEDGNNLVSFLIRDLQAIHTREDLVSASTSIQGYFDRLASLMISVEEFVDAHPEVNKEQVPPQERELSDQLRLELNRIYEIEGGREIIEKCEQSALMRLQQRNKKKGKCYTISEK